MATKSTPPTPGATGTSHPNPSIPQIESWPVSPFPTSWDDLLEGIQTAADWQAKREVVTARLQELLRMDAAPPVPRAMELVVHEEQDFGEYRVQYISYAVEEDERAHAYLALPNTPVPQGGFPGVVCLHGTTNWGARQTLGLLPETSDPHNAPGRLEKSAGKDFARRLALAGFATISPEHFCSARRMPPEGPYDTVQFYRKHPRWSAMGKAVYEARIATSILADHGSVNANNIGATGHSLGGHGTIFLAAVDARIRCAAPNCSALTFRENSEPLHWSRDHWYVYFPQLREIFQRGGRPPCDFHEIMGLIAPRPLFESISLNDGDRQGQLHRVALHLCLHRLYEMQDAGSAHAFLVFGDGHSVPANASAAMVAWMERWLKHDGDPDLAGNPRPFAGWLTAG